MVRILGLVKGYTPINIHTPDGNKVKINVRPDLLSPVGKNIVGTLHFNGTTVYVPRDGNLTIGSSPKCEIRIKDPAVEPFHAMVISVGEEVTVEHVFSSGKTAIVTSTNDIKTITDKDEPLPLSTGNKIVFPLSGDKKLLAVEFKLRQSFTEDVREFLTAQLQPKPTIKEVAVEQILVGQALATIEGRSQPLKTLVAGSPFAKARTVDEVLTIYSRKLKEAKKKDNKSYLICGSTTSLGFSGMIYFFLTTSGAAPGISAIPMLLTMAGIFSLGLAKIFSNRDDLNQCLGSILSILSLINADDVAHALAQKNTEEREMILSAIEKKDPRAVNAIRQHLSEAQLDETSETPRTRVKIDKVRIEPGINIEQAAAIEEAAIAEQEASNRGEKS